MRISTNRSPTALRGRRPRARGGARRGSTSNHCQTQKLGRTSNSRIPQNFGMTAIRGNTIHSEWPKPPPARREGSSGLFAMHCIKKPAKRDKEKNERFAVARIVRFSLSGLLFADKRFIDCAAARAPRARGGACDTAYRLCR